MARWCAECFNRMNNKNEKKKINNNLSCLCLCTKNLQCSDLIGQTKPCPNSDSNEILKFFPGFLVEAIEKGMTVVLFCINEANSTVCEILNGLIDKKNNEAEKFLISAFHSSNDDEGDLIIDCSYTKFFLEICAQGIPRYIQNNISCLAAPEKHLVRDNCRDGSEFRQKSGFKSKPLKNMKTLFAWIALALLIILKIILKYKKN